MVMVQWWGGSGDVITIQYVVVVMEFNENDY